MVNFESKNRFLKKKRCIKDFVITPRPKAQDPYRSEGMMKNRIHNTISKKECLKVHVN